MMIDKDCFGENPINGYRLNIDTPFLDIGIPVLIINRKLSYQTLLER